ncbi:MAG: hypothetical protein R2912_04305 [Eubacteriales bacterium]
MSYRTVAPATLSAIETYLGSGLIKGVGAATARNCGPFGMDTLSILDEDPCASPKFRALAQSGGT